MDTIVHRGGRSVRAVVERQRRRALWRRRMPAATMLLVGGGLVGLLALFQHTSPLTPSPALLTPSLDSNWISIPAREVTLGLSEDNKETVLNLCWRVSGNPNVECRVNYLRDRGEFPSRIWTSPALEVLRTEVTQGAYEECVAAGVCSEIDYASCRFFSTQRLELGRRVPTTMLAAHLPQPCVTHSQAENYCAHVGARLPSRDEWEALARAGDDRLQPWGAFWMPALMNWNERDLGGFPIAGRLDGFELLAPADSFSDGATPEGVQNLLGNLAEWTALREDGLSDVRGGSYRSELLDVRPTYGQELEGNSRRSDIGFRCVRSPS